jgi:NAD(P)-dependent dehydrogenase (short-subunit alcohol dehydrogenase family)
MTNGLFQIDGWIVVTGAGRGIGAGIAKSLCEQGAKVVVADLDLHAAEETCTALRELGYTVQPKQVDVTEETSVEALADAAVELGPLVGWVNNVGISQRVALLNLSVADWDRMMTVNSRSVFLGTRAAARRMKPGGAVVNLASVSSFVALPNLAHYGASKGAIVAFTKHAAIDLAPIGIRVNAVGPGTIESAMTQERLSDPEQRAWSERRIPTGRIGHPKDVGSAVAFLCSSAASYITGTVLMCDGGWTASA